MQITNFIPEGFWPQIAHQLIRIETEKPDTFDGVRDILGDPAYDCVVRERNRNDEITYDADSMFFCGTGGNDSLLESLEVAGWRPRYIDGEYHYSVTHQATGDTFVYTEGDVERAVKSVNKAAEAVEDAEDAAVRDESTDHTPYYLVVAVTDYNEIIELESKSDDEIVAHLARWGENTEDPTDIGKLAYDHVVSLKGSSTHEHHGATYLLSRGQYAVVLYQKM